MDDSGPANIQRKFLGNLPYGFPKKTLESPDLKGWWERESTGIPGFAAYSDIQFENCHFCQTIPLESKVG